MTKTVFTLNVNGYAPRITELTYPLLKAYAKKIGADFQVISCRRWPTLPPVYEKLQLYERGRAQDWNIYIDADTLIHPDFFDVTDHLKKDTVCHNGVDMAGNRWRYDEYFRRDGRHIGSCNWFTCGSNWCLDLWRPLDDLTFEDAVSRITPTLDEARAGITADHLIDDYTLSRNIARFGLKFLSVRQLLQHLGDNGNYLWHQYLLPEADKIAQMKELLAAWHV